MLSDPADRFRRDHLGNTYGVRLVRGPVVTVEPHPLSCDDEDALASLVQELPERSPLAVDLFCGAGGLSLGLSQAGFNVILGVDTDDGALDTHRSICPGLSANWDLSDEATIDRVAGIIERLGVSLLAGGPPCQPFSKAGRSGLRHLVAQGRRGAEDHRARLWQSFLEIALRARPPAVLMENVPDMVLDRDMLVLRSMVDELERTGYTVSERLVDTWRYGVPQFRQRLILVAVARGKSFEWPSQVLHQSSVRHAIEDLPPVEGGWRPAEGEAGFLPYAPERQSSYQKEMRRLVPSEHRGVVFDHITRPVREDDARAFAVMDSTTKYSDLPEELKRYRDDIFDDKYNRLDWDQLSRTITAHIAKDGYGYIHPDQDRTITIREAARLQTFPDHVRFAGSPSSAFQQIGNAVPPRLAQVLGAELVRSLEQTTAKHPPTTRDLQHKLAGWVRQRFERSAIASPWHGLSLGHLLAGEEPPAHLRWKALVAQVLFDRVPTERIRMLWPTAESQLSTPEATTINAAAVHALAFALGRARRADEVVQLATEASARPSTLEDPAEMEQLPGVTKSLTDVVFRLVPSTNHDVVVAPSPLLRVAARFWGQPVDVMNKRSDGRLAVARLVGVDEESASTPVDRWASALASIALFEVAAHVCRPVNPLCGSCPLQDDCRSRDELDSGQLSLSV